LKLRQYRLQKFEEREEEIRAEFAENFEALFRTNQIQKKKKSISEGSGFIDG